MDLDYFKKIAKIYCMLLPDPTPCPNVAVLTASRIIVHLSFGCLDKVNYWGSNAFSSHMLKTFPRISKDAIPHGVEDAPG